MTTSATSTEIASPELLTPPDPGGVMSLSGAPALTSRGVRGIKVIQDLFLILIFFTQRFNNVYWSHQPCRDQPSNYGVTQGDRRVEAGSEKLYYLLPLSATLS